MVCNGIRNLELRSAGTRAVSMLLIACRNCCRSAQLLAVDRHLYEHICATNYRFHGINVIYGGAVCVIRSTGNLILDQLKDLIRSPW